MRDVGGQQALSVPARREGDGGRPTVYGRLPTGWSAGDGLRWAERSQRPEPLVVVLPPSFRNRRTGCHQGYESGAGRRSAWSREGSREGGGYRESALDDGGPTISPFARRSFF